nr:uncharacterized protein LOC109619991 isoform X3 [Crassostrea gigas]
MGLSLQAQLCIVVFGIVLSSCIHLHEFRKLDGYSFSVYLADYCPRNETEWKARSTAINCTDKNGYACLPNKNITELLEFCYTIPFIWIEEGVCLYLNKRPSIVLTYNCSQFQFGCPNSSHTSFDLFENPECTSIGNGCFLAEPSCYRLTSPAYDQQTTQKSRIENIAWSVAGAIFGVFPLMLISLCLYISNRKGNQTQKRHDGVQYVEDETSQLIPHNHPDRMESITKGNQTHIRYDDRGNMEDDVAQPVLQNHPDRMESTEESPLDRLIFEQWEEDNTLFVPTKACEEVKNLINNRNVVVVTGHSGCGKSAAIHHIALEYRNSGWIVKPVVDVKEMMQIIRTMESGLLNRTLFILNDPIGQDSFDEMEYIVWRKYEETLQACLRNVKLLLTCRKIIQSDVRVKGLLKDTSNVVDLSSDELSLSNSEKIKIWSVHSSNELVCDLELEKIVQTESYFPLLCKLYSKQNIERKDRLRFFTEPFEVLEEEIIYLREYCKEKYCALILLVLFNNVFCVENLNENELSREKFKQALKLCNMESNTAPHTIGNSLKTLQGFLVKRIGDTYHFYHDFVMEVTTFVFGNDDPIYTIKYADIGFLRKRVKLKEYDDESEHFTIYLKDKHLPYLGKRLLNDILGERLLDVVLNPCLKHEKMANAFIEELKHTPEKLPMFVEKKKIGIQINQTSECIFYSKLFFLYLQEEISPLSALIVFCHKNISLHCLKAVKHERLFIESNQFFSAVCCNGSLDLFALFSTNDIKACLLERNDINPVHIASMFYNFETLRELIHFGGDVNLKTSEKYGYCTPLLLASEYKTEEDITKGDTNQLDRNNTVRILLDNGADVNLCSNCGKSPLYLACQSGHENTVRLLLLNRANINLCDDNRSSPLQVACVYGYDNIAKLLLRNGADINSCDNDGNSILLSACVSRYESIVQFLINNGADIDLCNNIGISPIFEACKLGQIGIVELLLSNKAETNSCSNCGTSPLLNACAKGYDSIAKLLISNGADINLCSNDGQSPLHAACTNGHLSIVQLLISKRADINSCSNVGHTPLYEASKNGHESIVELLLRNKAEINSCKNCGSSPLLNACAAGYDSIVQLLISNGAETNLCNNGGSSPLHLACYNGHYDIIKKLLSNKADINMCCKSGATALLLACERGYDNIVRYLISNEANINLCTNEGCSPLHQACQNGHYSIVQLLLSKGADINVCPDDGFSPMLLACLNGHDRIVQHLLDNGADINVCLPGGQSPLYIACCVEHYSTVQLLLRYGVDINLCSNDKTSPLHIASKNGHDSIVQLLLSKNADINLCHKHGASPFFTACQSGHDSIVKLLLNAGVDINQRMENKTGPIFAAFANRHHRVVKILLENNTDTNIIKGCGLQCDYFDCDDKDDITMTFLLQPHNIIDNIHDPDSYYSLFVFCQIYTMETMCSFLNDV